MTTIETATGCRITVGPKGLALWDRSAHLIGYELSTPLTADERRALVAALNPGQGGQWTRDDFARLDIHPLSPAGEVIDEVVAWLNAHYPKPQPYDQGGVRGADSLLYRAERERDAAVARAEQMEQKLAKVMFDYQYVEDERDEWKARAEVAWTRTAVSRADVSEALGRCLNPETWDVTFPAIVNEICDLFGVEAEAVDPVEAKARVEADRRYSGDPNHAFIEGAVWAARHVLGQEAGDE